MKNGLQFFPDQRGEKNIRVLSESMYPFLIIVRKEERNYSILNYENNFTYIMKNSSNNFKKLEKKQNVRLSFIQDVNKLIFAVSNDEKA